MTEMTTDLIIESTDIGGVEREQKIAKQCADHLHQHYPGHLWAVNVNSVGGTVNIFNLALSSIYGYLLRMTTVEHDAQLKCVMRAGGELLERARLAKQYKGDIPTLVDGMPDKFQPGKRLKLN